jgi:hypothetical protein
MPFTCVSYPSDVPPDPAGPRQLPTNSACFCYQPDAPRSMPAMCFSDPPARPDRIENGGEAWPAPPGLRQMPGTLTCFRY